MRERTQRHMLTPLPSSGPWQAPGSDDISVGLQLLSRGSSALSQLSPSLSYTVPYL